jgi:predicted regulator of Ras-like GTPase activity (Roadblock/LC7/MglB family)
MPRLEDVLAELAALPHARAAALAGFDGLLVDEAFLLADTDGSSGADGPTVADGSTVGVRAPALDGAVVELTHAWNGVRRACADYLDGGGAREMIVVADGGLVLSHTVANAWFALVWADPEVDVERARAALRGAAERLVEVVA